jgi:hypothetical protein
MKLNETVIPLSLCIIVSSEPVVVFCLTILHMHRVVLGI